MICLVVAVVTLIVGKCFYNPISTQALLVYKQEFEANKSIEWRYRGNLMRLAMTCATLKNGPNDTAALADAKNLYDELNKMPERAREYRIKQLIDSSMRQIAEIKEKNRAVEANGNSTGVR